MSRRRPVRVGGRRQAGVVKGVLLFLAGVLVGANLLYLAVTRDAAPNARSTAVTARGVPTPPAQAGAAARVPAQGENPGTAAASTDPPRVQPPPAPSLAQGGVTPPAPTVAGLQPLLLPVQGVGAGALQDTFNDARAQGRSHEAIDIMAPAGTPVLAVADGTVEKLFTSVAGGLTVYQFEPTGRYAYYYAHLQGYAPGLAEKQALRRGDLIGYVGSTGNANPAAPHLHFAVFVLGPERRWWQGTAINPYPLLRGQ